MDILWNLLGGGVELALEDVKADSFEYARLCFFDGVAEAVYTREIFAVGVVLPVFFFDGNRVGVVAHWVDPSWRFETAAQPEATRLPNSRSLILRSAAGSLSKCATAMAVNSSASCSSVSFFFAAIE